MSNFDSLNCGRKYSKVIEKDIKFLIIVQNSKLWMLTANPLQFIKICIVLTELLPVGFIVKEAQSVQCKKALFQKLEVNTYTIEKHICMVAQYTEVEFFYLSVK